MLADELLEQARHLADRNRRLPNQADLRRALSTAYYALFHLLSEDAAHRLTPVAPALLRARIARALSHAEMKQVCKSIVSNRLTSTLLELQPIGFSPQLRSVAERFSKLQEERHRADYDLAAVFDRVEVLEQLLRAEQAFTDWRAVRSSDEATVFLAALLFAGRWAR